MEELIKIRYPHMNKYKTSILQYKKREEIRLLFFIYILSISKDKHTSFLLSFWWEAKFPHQFSKYFFNRLICINSNKFIETI